MAFARWGGASWEQDLSWGHGETLVRPGCLRSSSALLHLSPKTRGGGRLLCWPPRQSAHLGCSAATGRLCCQVGLSLSTALQTSVTSLQDALQCTACLHWLTLSPHTWPRPQDLVTRPFAHRCHGIQEAAPPAVTWSCAISSQLLDMDPSWDSTGLKTREIAQNEAVLKFWQAACFSELPAGAVPGERSKNRAAACTCGQAVDCVQWE